MKKTEGIYTYRCNVCETVIGIVSRFGVNADRLKTVKCPKCSNKASLYGEGHMKYSIYQNINEERKERESKETKIRQDFSQYPPILNATHVSEILGISRRYAYEIMNWTDFPTIKLGNSSKRVSREDFINWLSNQNT